MTERFELLEQVGKGGMGTVCKARDGLTDEIVALKLLHEMYVDEEDYVARFEREVDIARKIDSPHVVKVLGYGRRNSVPYVAMEYVDGPSLKELIRERGAVSWDEWGRGKSMALQMARALAAAHAAGVIHRDVKPSNVLIDPQGNVKLADFGIARAADLTRMTGGYTMLGTPAYMSPEGDSSVQSDLYGLGCVLYEMLAGSPPFTGDTQQQVLLKHIRETPDLSKLPVGARRIVGWLLEKDPRKRPATAEAFIGVLEGSTGNSRPRAALPGSPSGPIAATTDRTLRRQQLERKAAELQRDYWRLIGATILFFIGAPAAVAVIIWAITGWGSSLPSRGGSEAPLGQIEGTDAHSAISAVTTTALASERFTAVSAGWFHTCGLRNDGTVACLGDNGYGQATPPEGKFVSVAAGMYHTCGLLVEGSVVCWGDNSGGRASAPAGEFASLSAGRLHTCGVRLDGRVACWGDDSNGQATPPEGQFASVSASWFHTCGVKRDGGVACWGANGSGQVSPPGGVFISVTAGVYHSCGLTANNTVSCWGSNNDGQAQDPTGSFLSVSAGLDRTCGMRADGVLTCWGAGRPPTNWPNEFTSVNVSMYRTCAVRSDGNLACWPNVANGEAGSTTP